jgi:hypothetical protein
MIIFEFLPQVPELFQATMLQYLSEFREITPNWCTKILIEWDSTDDGDTCIYTIAEYEYRWAKMTFCAAFFNQSPATQREMVLHELLHIFVLIESRYVREVIKKLLTEDKDKALKDLILDEIRNRHEAVTEDLTQTVLKLIDKPKIQ